ncbi:unnamed protein product, partial [Urochloa humidicola]
YIYIYIYIYIYKRDISISYPGSIQLFRPRAIRPRRAPRSPTARSRPFFFFVFLSGPLLPTSLLIPTFSPVPPTRRAASADPAASPAVPRSLPRPPPALPQLPPPPAIAYSPVRSRSSPLPPADARRLASHSPSRRRRRPCRRISPSPLVYPPFDPAAGARSASRLHGWILPCECSWDPAFHPVSAG